MSRLKHPRIPAPSHIAPRKGITLIELSIVLLVLGIIMGIVFYALADGGKKTRQAAAKLAVKNHVIQLTRLVEKYEREVGSLHEGDSLALLTQPHPDHRDAGPIAVPEQVRDPWKRPYVVQLDDNGRRDICSLGRDGREGGAGEDSDFCLGDRRTWPHWLRDPAKRPAN